MRIKIISLRRSKLGIDVRVKYPVGSEWETSLIENVSENIVRCALGEDVDYLLSDKCSNDESQCFSISSSEFKDFLKYRCEDD